MATGQPFRHVLLEPFALTLVIFGQLLDHDRIEGHLAQFRQLDEAYLTALAFNEPARLDRERERLVRLVRRASPISRTEREATLEAARAMMREIDAVEMRSDRQWLPYLGDAIKDVS
jgi:hypothetical protein